MLVRRLSGSESRENKYMLLSCCKKAVQKHSIKIASRSFESVAKFKYLETTLTDQNCMQEEIKSRLNSGNACYHSVVLYGCETLSLTLGEENRLRMFENRVLRRIFWHKRDEVTGE
jgi:hypothetical protein